METVTTERLIIRHVLPSDLTDYLAYRNHPATLQEEEPQSEEEAAKLLSRFAVPDAPNTPDAPDTDGYRMLAVELKDEPRMIGEVGIYVTVRDNKGDLGWSIHPDYQRQGYATEAARCLLPYAFQELNLHRVTASCEARNRASSQIMEHLGMRREGHFRQSRVRNGVWLDEYQYALLREEWQPVRS